MKRLILILFTAYIAVSFTAEKEILWYDGSRDKAGVPGKLLSDNSGYWGECILTGVDYEYETELLVKDIFRNDSTIANRRLNDGVIENNYYSGADNWAEVSTDKVPITAVFDFKRSCVFSEIDILSPQNKLDIRIELSDKDSSLFSSVVEGSFTSNRPDVDTDPDLARAHMGLTEPLPFLFRIKLPAGLKARYVKMTISGGEKSILRETYFWGDADITDPTEEYLKPVVSQPIANTIALQSIPGISNTAYPDWEFFDWKRSIREYDTLPAVWSLRNSWGELSSKPIIPSYSEINKPIVITITRNEGESVAVALTNTDMTSPVSLNVNLSDITDLKNNKKEDNISADLKIFGAMPSRWYGTVLSPLFSTNNMLGKSLMKKYLTNASSIIDFPKVNLSPAGSVVMWVTIKTDNAKPGKYSAMLSYKEGSGIPIQINVIDITLPDEKIWFRPLDNRTVGMYKLPFVYSDMAKNELDYKLSIGKTVFETFPYPGTPAYEARKQGKHVISCVYKRELYMKVYLGKVTYISITEKDKKEWIDFVEECKLQAKETGVVYDDWVIDIVDEPGIEMSKTVKAIAEIIKAHDPKVRLTVNPSFWVDWAKGATSDDKTIYESLYPWYNQLIDVSIPLMTNLHDRPKSLEIWKYNRMLNAFYMVSTHHMKSESPKQTQFHREMPWIAMENNFRGWEIWAFDYAEGDPWNDLDEPVFFNAGLPDDCIVYPSMNGFVPSRSSEAFREGYEDYCLMQLLKSKDKNGYNDIMVKFKSGNYSFEQLRMIALGILQ